MWEADTSNRFRKNLKRMSPEMRQKAQEAMKTLLIAERPETMGEPKTASRDTYFAWDLGRECRIVYRPRKEEKVIEFERVCSHKEAYEP